MNFKPSRTTPFLLKKIKAFIFYNIILQIIPVIFTYSVTLLFSESSKTINPFQLDTMLILSGCAWLAIPSFFHIQERTYARIKAPRITTNIVGGAIFVVGILIQGIKQLTPHVSNKFSNILMFYNDNVFLVNIAITTIPLLLSLLVLMWYHRRSMDVVTLRLLWTHQSQFAGIYVAKEKGYFESRGIDVMILEGGPGKSPLQFAVNKQDDFAIVSGTDIVRSRNTNTPLKSLAIIIPKSPICFYSFDKANINSAKDWSGKRIALPQNYEVEYYVYAILENAGLPRESVTIQLCSSQAEIEKKLIDNEVDIISGYRTNYPILNESINDKLKTLTLEACGITTVGDTLAAKDVLVNQRRSLVRSFVDATIAGWEYAIQEINEDETLDYVLKYMPHGSDRKYQKYCLLGITNMIGNDFPHEQHEHTWAEIKEFLIKYNLADKDVELFSCFAGY